MKGFPKATGGGHMNGFPKAAEVDNFSLIFYFLQLRLETRSNGH
jgi:prolyl oligopeptidase PreP (S9A serine peptidase family)